MKKVLSIGFIIILVLISFSEIFAQQYTKYVTVTGAGNHNGTSLANAMTLDEANSNAVPGDYIFVQKGTYQYGNSSPTTGGFSFNKSGTSSQPIIWEGEISATDLWLGVTGNKTGGNVSISSSGINSTKLCTDRNQTNGSDNTFSFSGDYQIFRRIVFQEDASQKQLFSIDASPVTFDSCAFKYPSNSQSSSIHLGRTSQPDITFKYCHIMDSPRTFMWASWLPGGSKPDNLTYDHCTFTGHSGHPAFQIFPYTNNTTPDLDPVYGVTITYNTFVDINFSDVFYLRHNSEFRVIGNLVVNANRFIGLPMHAYNGYDGSPVDTTGGGLILFNTHIVTDANAGFFIKNEGTQRLEVKNNLIITIGTGGMYGNYWINMASHYDNQPAPPNVGMDFDYNMYYDDSDASFTDADFRWPTSNTATTQYPLASWQSVRGFDLNSTGTTRPTFLNEAGRDFSPLNGSSPQVGAGVWDDSWGIPAYDMYGNPRDPNNPTIGAIEYNTGVGDIFPPNLLGATIINSTSLVLNFSEPLSPSTAQNINNYAINNGISVTGAAISGSQVTLTTSEHSAGSYTVTVNNVTDLAGNVINPNNNTASYAYVQPDVTPPDLLSAVINNATSLTLNFSELLSSSTALNINNYTINNGINVSAVSMSGLQVTLTTSPHGNGSYVVTVNNVTDLAGNVINPNSNSASYTYIQPDVTPPNLLSAVINNSTNLTLNFSELLSSSTALNINNYSINNGINVSAVSMSGLQVMLTTSPHSNGNYVVTVNNVTDLAGNVINPNSNSANYDYSVGDIIPPQLVSATLLDSVNLELIFSEGLEIVSAQVISNYSISNNIIVNSAQLSVNLYKVILHTSQHFSGQTYSLTAQNVKDLSGNMISQTHNSADYIYIFDNIPPDVSNLTTTNTKNMTVNFSEKLDPVKANNKNNYSISNNILINSVQLLPDSMSVLLKTSTQQRELDYSLTISNVTDKSGNNISPNPKSVSYRISKRGKGRKTKTPISNAISNSWSGNYLPEKTIDGDGMNNPDSRWMSGVIMPDTICYDLGSNSSLDSLRISFYKWETNRQYKYSVYGSEDSLNWQPIVNNIWSESLEWTEIEFDSTQARFLRLILLESNQSPWASLWEIELYGPSVTTNINIENEVPSSLILSQNYPNPFNPSTTIRYQLPKDSKVVIKIYNILGSEVMELVNEQKEAGIYEVEFKVDNLSSGTYIYKIIANNFVETKKMILLK